MPVPLLLLGAELVAWGRAALLTYGLAELFSNESVSSLVAKVEAWAVSIVAERTGLHLDQDAPFTDASFAQAIGDRVGIPLRSLKDREMLKEDLGNYVISTISEKTGYVIHSVTDADVLRADLLRIGGAVMAERLGLPVGVMPGDGEAFDPATVRERLLSWAKAELLNGMSEEVQTKLDDIVNMGDLESVVNDLNSRLASMGSHENLTARQLAVRIASQMATDAVVGYQQVAKGETKRSRRQAQLKAAQDKFRKRHGIRQVYVPLNMSYGGVNAEPPE